MKIYKLKSKESLVGIKKYYSSRNKICISRKCGGFGDILVSRMIFEDLKKCNPEFEIIYAIPTIFHQVAANHPHIDKLIDCNENDPNDFISVYDITNICSGYEAVKRKNLDKHRADIWAESIGIKLNNHNMHLPKFEEFKSKIYDMWKKLGYKEGQKIVCITPKSAVQIRNLPDEIVKLLIEKFTRDDVFLFLLNHIPVLNFQNIPFCRGSNYTETMAILSYIDGLISTDTGTLHCAGGYQKPILGIFNYTSGKIIGKYYDNIIIVQKTDEHDEKWICGPCNDYSRCPFEIKDHVLQCTKEITTEMINEGISKFNQKLGLNN